VIDIAGKMLGIFKTSEALKMAIDEELDLVEVSPNAQPPVVKLINFDKYRYHQTKLAQEAKKKINKVTVKAIRLSVRIGQHDLEFKAKKAAEFLSEGHKVKIDIRMRGREQAHPELVFEMLKKFQSLISVPSTVAEPAKRLGPTVSMTLGLNK